MPTTTAIRSALNVCAGRVDDGFLKRIEARLAKSGTVGAPNVAQPRQSSSESGSASQAVSEEGRKMQALEDLIVQTEIFLQYSLQAKALERLQKIAAMFPGEEERHPRLRNLYQLANWWPQGAPKAKARNPRQQSRHQRPPAPLPEPATSNIGHETGVYTAETLRDLSKISEINQKIFRQQTPRAMLNTAVNEVGGYLRASRALAVVGAPGRPPEIAAEYCAQGFGPRRAPRWCSCSRTWKKRSPTSLAA